MAQIRPMISSATVAISATSNRSGPVSSPYGDGHQLLDRQTQAATTLVVNVNRIGPGGLAGFRGALDAAMVRSIKALRMVKVPTLRRPWRFQGLMAAALSELTAVHGHRVSVRVGQDEGLTEGTVEGCCQDGHVGGDQ